MAALAATSLVQWLRSLIFTTYLFVITPVYSLIIVLVFWLPYSHRYKLAVHWARNILWVLKVVCGLQYVVHGRENIPAGNHISMWKHSSSWETVAQMVIFPPQAWVLKRELLWIPVVGWAIKLMRPIGIDRGSGHAAVRKLVEQGKQRLASGMWVLIFPEGTRVSPGMASKYGASGALLALQTSRSLVPVAHNAGRYWPRRGWLKKPGTIQVVIGPAIAPGGHTPRELNLKVQRWIEDQLGTLDNAP